MRENSQQAAKTAPEPEYPRSEPEILPPDDDGSPFHAGRNHGSRTREYVFVDREGRTRRFQVKTPGPFTALLVLLVLGLIAAVILAFFLGALLIALPVAIVGTMALIAYAWIRGSWRRLRGG